MYIQSHFYNISMIPNGLFYLDIPRRNYSLIHSSQYQDITSDQLKYTASGHKTLAVHHLSV